MATFTDRWREYVGTPVPLLESRRRVAEADDDDEGEEGDSEFTDLRRDEPAWRAHAKKMADALRRDGEHDKAREVERMLTKDERLGSYDDLDEEDEDDDQPTRQRDTGNPGSQRAYGKGETRPMFADEDIDDIADKMHRQEVGRERDRSRRRAEMQQAKRAGREDAEEAINYLRSGSSLDDFISEVRPAGGSLRESRGPRLPRMSNAATINFLRGCNC